MSRELPQITLQQRQMMMTVIWLALIMGVVTFGMIVTFIGLKEEPGKGLPVIFMVRMIIGLALLEGAAMINLVAVMVENQKLAFIPVAILLLVMIASMPTKSKLDGWIRNQMENYNLEHQN